MYIIIYGTCIYVYGCFHNLGVLVVGVLAKRAPLFGVYVRAPEFWKLPYVVQAASNWAVPDSRVVLVVSRKGFFQPGSAILAV